jgi:lipopolysaccharide/colanic/teichoic acid biosynthesis glycosyltransferase
MIVHIPAQPHFPRREHQRQTGDPGSRWWVVQVQAKRSVDLVAATTLLLVLVPLLLLIAALVWLSSPGPILFRQRRIGKDGREFWMYKFRSMVANADTGVHRAYCRALIAGEARPIDGTFKLQRDDRVTAIGRILRRFSLDELPQLLNVIRGDMSLVGPRPPIRYEVEMYGTRELVRLSVPPGVTGLWQVSGRNALSFKQMIDLDLAYIEHWSLWLDVRIMLRTPLSMITGRGAC